METSTAAPISTAARPEIQFLKGAEAVRLRDMSATPENAEQITIKKIQESLAEAMNAKHVAFLLGSGCSSLKKDGRQVGIPTMQPLAEKFSTETGGRGIKNRLSKTEKSILKSACGINVEAAPYNENLEALMEVLYSWKFSLQKSPQQRHKTLLKTIIGIISKLKLFLYEQCTTGPFSQGDDSVQSLYETFYKKLIYRDRSLPRPWVFTTNYDLFNETGMDRLGLPYTNGFAGTIDRRFNPAVFRYALAEQLDVTSRKWAAVDGFVYLGKLHGSISWVEEEMNGLFPVRELQNTKDRHNSLMVYPTPAKHASSLSSPYTDLFREFQHRIVREQSVLFVLGYSFGDAHINNIIYQALTIPNFRVVIFADPMNLPPAIAKLNALKDSRVWIIGGQDTAGRPAHYFDYYIEKFMPESPGDQVDKAVKKVITSLIGRSASEGEPSNDPR